MLDPISRLQFVRDEIDRLLGEGFSAAHPAVMQSASSDYAAITIARALQDIAVALAEPEMENGPIMRAARQLAAAVAAP
jgi:hypothetical protein